jgi:uncharacterized protein YcbK (DUF882 family)
MSFNPQLTKNFHLREWNCKEGGGTGVPWDLVDNVIRCATSLQALRDEIGEPVRLISGWRGELYNKRVGGSKKSQHLKGLAADIRVSGMKPEEVAAIIEDLIEHEKMDEGGVGIYSGAHHGFVHYDCRGTRARWNG